MWIQAPPGAEAHTVHFEGCYIVIMEITEAHKNVISVRQKKKRWLITYCLNLTKRRFGYFATLTIIKVSVILCL